MEHNNLFHRLRVVFYNFARVDTGNVVFVQNILN